MSDPSAEQIEAAAESVRRLMQSDRFSSYREIAVAALEGAADGDAVHTSVSMSGERDASTTNAASSVPVVRPSDQDDSGQPIMAARRDVHDQLSAALQALRMMYDAFFGQETTAARYAACGAARAVFADHDGPYDALHGETSCFAEAAMPEPSAEQIEAAPDCGHCGGSGVIADHGPSCYAKGECTGAEDCPQPVQCECQR